MRDAFGGRYRPTEGEFARLWEEGLFVFDANVLLNLYRYSEGARGDLLSVMRALGDRAWLPHQAAEEFLERRLQVMHRKRRRYQDASAGVEKARNEIEESMGELHRDRAVEAEDLLSSVREALDGLVEHLRTREEGLPAESSSPEDDPVWRAVEDIFGDRIGGAYEPERRRQIVEEGRDRYDRKVPPGYEDEEKDRKTGNGKGERRFGDLLLWYQALDKAEETQGPVVLITDDRKEDWWWKSHGLTIGPRPELVEEMRRRSGTLFYMYRPERLLDEAGKRGLIGEAVSEDTLEEIEDLGSLDDDLPASREQVGLLIILAEETWGERGAERLAAVTGAPLKELTRGEASLWIDRLTDEVTRDASGLGVPYGERWGTLRGAFYAATNEQRRGMLAGIRALEGAWGGGDTEAKLLEIGRHLGLDEDQTLYLFEQLVREHLVDPGRVLRAPGADGPAAQAVGFGKINVVVGEGMRVTKPGEFYLGLQPRHVSR